MKQQQFEAQYRALWARFADLLAESSKKKSKKNAAARADLASEQALNTGADKSTEPAGYEFVQLYRLICQHYALAQQRHYIPQLVTYFRE